VEQFHYGLEFPALSVEVCPTLERTKDFDFGGETIWLGTPGGLR